MGISKHRLRVAIGLLTIACATAAQAASRESTTLPAATQPDKPAAAIESNGVSLFLAFSPDGKWLYSADEDGTLKKWDVAKRTEVWNRKTEADLNYKNSLQLSPDGSLLAVLSNWKNITLLSTADGKDFKKASALGKDQEEVSILGITFSHDGQSIYASARREGIKCWSWKENKVESVFEKCAVFQVPGADLPCVDASRDGRYFVMYGSTALVRFSILDPKNPADEMSVSSERRGCNLFHYVRLSPDGRIVAKCSIANRTELRESLTLQRIYVSEVVHRRGVTFSPDSRWFALPKEDGIGLVSLMDGTELAWLKIKSPQAMAISPDGTMLAAGSGSIALWDLRPILRAAVRPSAPAEDDLGDLWDKLASDDATGAWKARGILAAGTAKTAAFLKGRLEFVAPPDAQALAKLIANLDSSRFRVRKAARDQLATYGRGIEGDLKTALKTDLSSEVRNTVRSLLEDISSPQMVVQHSRAVAVLEDIARANAGEEPGAAAAKAVLKTLATNAANAETTIEARLALRRLGEPLSLEGRGKGEGDPTPEPATNPSTKPSR